MDRSTAETLNQPALPKSLVKVLDNHQTRHPTLAQGMLIGHRRGEFNKADEAEAQRRHLENLVSRNSQYRGVLEALRDRFVGQDDALGIIRQSTFKVEYRLVIGFGLPTILETGILLHPLYGVPYLPGSAIKGVTQSWLLHGWAGEAGVPRLGYAAYRTWTERHPRNAMPLKAFETLLAAGPGEHIEKLAEDVRSAIRLWATVSHVEDAKRDARLKAFDVWLTTGYGDQKADLYRKLFGDAGKQGKVTYLDAFPIPGPSFKMKVDILTPHFGPYYTQPASGATVEPGDYFDPTPVPFLVVDRGSQFSVSVMAPTTDLAEAAIEAVGRALKHHGIGSKTSSGYGRLLLTEG